MSHVCTETNFVVLFVVILCTMLLWFWFMQMALIPQGESEYI
jgi:hypothetical protein